MHLFDQLFIKTSVTFFTSSGLLYFENFAIFLPSYLLSFSVAIPLYLILSRLIVPVFFHHVRNHVSNALCIEQWWCMWCGWVDVLLLYKTHTCTHFLHSTPLHSVAIWIPSFQPFAFNNWIIYYDKNVQRSAFFFASLNSVRARAHVRLPKPISERARKNEKAVRRCMRAGKWIEYKIITLNSITLVRSILK